MMGWDQLARVSAIAIGTTFVTAAGAYIVAWLLLFDL